MTSYSKLSESELTTILAEYGEPPAQECVALPGGWANSNFRVQLADGRLVCVKVCDEKTFETLADSLRAIAHLRAHSYPVE